MSGGLLYPNLPEQSLDLQSQLQEFLTRFQGYARQESPSTLLLNLPLPGNTVLPVRISMPLGFPRLAPVVTAQRAIGHPLCDAAMNISVSWGQGSTLSILASSLHQEFQRVPPQFLDMDSLSRPGVHIDFKPRLKELGLVRVQALTEEDVTAYALTVPQVTLLYANRNMLLKECAQLANTNVLIRDRIVEERKAALAEAEAIDKKTEEFKEHLLTLRSLTRTSANYISEINAEIARLTSHQTEILTNLRAEPNPEHLQAYLQLRIRFRELEAIKSLLIS